MPKHNRNQTELEARLESVIKQNFPEDSADSDVLAALIVRSLGEAYIITPREAAPNEGSGA